MRFIVKHSVSTHLTEALAILAAVWLRGLGGREPNSVVISADTRISRSPHEREAWLASGLTIFFLRSFAEQPAWEQAAKLVKWWPDIVKEAKKARRGTGFVVTIHGKIERLTH